ncbi:MAG TPA: peptidase M6 [Candidatus Binatia bacterium]|nr:peptidase M6 [Candidatus Binatia bacterium]
MKRSKRTVAVLTMLSLLASLSGVAIAGVSAAGPKVKDTPIKEVGPDYNHGEPLPFDRADTRNANPPLGPAKIGETKTWLGLDDYRGVINLKNYTLRGVGTHVEVWVGTNLNFPNRSMLNPLTPDPTDFFTYDDCRNDGVRNVITDEQVQYLIDQFDNNIYPLESDWWGTPPNRKGNKNALAKQLGFPQSYYRGEGDNIVVLVDNIRDGNFYDPNNSEAQSYIAGFYFSVFDDFVDRTVMSIDAWDWIHRTGDDPPHAPTADPCTSAPARPNLYEGVFAHEYSHLIHHYTDPDEVSWVNEGLADFTEIFTGYADISRHVDEKGYEGHSQCYLGWVSVMHPDWNPIPRPCGPENGLTAWGDQGDDEILADYGFAMYFMNYLASQGLDKDFFTSWFQNAGNGIVGLENALAAAGDPRSFRSLFEDQIISSLIDGYLDNGATGAGSQYQNAAAEATIFFSDEAHADAGAPPWGADYIDLGAGDELDSVVFDGDDAVEFPDGTNWVVDEDGYYSSPDVGDTGEYGSNQDEDMTHAVTGGGTLTFEHYYAFELGWDFGFVQVSTDGGETFTSLACTGTTSEHDPGAIGTIVAELPGFSGPTPDDTDTSTIGTAAEPVSSSCTIPAGATHISFRMMTDPLAFFDGWHVRNIELDGSPVGTPGSLAGWTNQKFLDPLELTFGLAFVGINGEVDAFGDILSADSVTVLKPTLDAGQSYTLTADDLEQLSGFDRVVAVVWGIPDEESSTTYQPYSLMVNGTEVADGG